MAFTTPKTWSALEEVLAADFNTHIRDNFNAVWVGTTHGDMDYYHTSTTKSRIPIGTARQVLEVDTLTGHPTWADSPQSVMTTKGDMLWASSTNTLASLAIGTEGQSLRASSGSPVWTSGALFVQLTTPLLSPNWSGDSFSTTAKTIIDLSDEFNVPAGVKAVYISLGIRDSASLTTDTYIILSPNDTADSGPKCSCGGRGNDMWEYEQMIVPCDANGDIYYQVLSSGASTIDAWLSIWGYWV